MKKSVKVLFAALMLPVALSIFACGKTEAPQEETSVSMEALKAEDLYGTWVGTGGEISTVSFASNGYYKDDAGDIYMEGTYTVDSVNNTVTVTENEYGLVFVYSVVISDDKLTLQVDGGKPRNFYKK